MTKELLQHRIDRCERAIKSYPCYLDMKKDTCHCGWSKGYYEGRKEVYEEWLDAMKEEEDDKRV